MCRRLSLSVVLVFVVLVAPSRAEGPGFFDKLAEKFADHIAEITDDPLEFAIKFTFDKTLSLPVDIAKDLLLSPLIDRVTGKPNIREIDRRLKELEESAALKSEMREEIRRVRAELNERVTKEELRKILSGLETELCSIKRRISALEERSEQQEVEINDLKNGTKNAMDAGFFLKRGRDFAENKEFHRAIANFTLAVRLDGKLTDAYIGRACAFENIRASEIAFLDFSKAIHLEPKCVFARNWRGALYFKFANFNKAIDDFTVALDINDKDVYALLQRAEAWLKLKGYASAVDDYKAALELTPANAIAWNNLGVSHQELGDYESAASDYSRAIAIDPIHPLYRSNRGKAYYKVGKYSDAIEDCDVAIGRGSNYVWAWESRGLSKYLTGKKDEAVPDLTRAIELGTTDENAYAFRGQWYLDQKENAKAVTDLRKAILLGATGWRVRDDRADANYRLGYYSDAIDDYTYSIDNNKVDVELKARSHWYRGHAHNQRNNREAYRSDIAEALRLDESYQKKLKYADVRVHNKTRFNVDLEMNAYTGPNGTVTWNFLSEKFSFAPGEKALLIYDGKNITASYFSAYLHANNGKRLRFWSYKSGATFDVVIEDDDLP